MLFVVVNCCLAIADCCLLFVICVVLFAVACCLMFIVCCFLFRFRCLLCVLLAVVVVCGISVAGWLFVVFVLGSCLLYAVLFAGVADFLFLALVLCFLVLSWCFLRHVLWFVVRLLFCRRLLSGVVWFCLLDVRRRVLVAVVG